MDSYDIRDTIIPFSLLQVTNRLKQMKVGDRLNIIYSDPSIETDLKSLLSQSEYRMTISGSLMNNQKDFQMTIQKKFKKSI